MEASLYLTSTSPEAQLTPATVIVPLDGTTTAEAGLTPARWLCGVFDATLQRVTVELAGAPDAGAPDAGVDPVGRVDPDGEVEYVLHGTDVATALTTHLAQQPGPVVCMASRARGGLHRRLTGNLVDDLATSGSAPMLVVGPGAEAETSAIPPATILLAASDELPAGATALCGRWAMAMDADVVVATVLPPVRAAAARGHDTGRRQASDLRGVDDGYLGGVTRVPAGEDDALLGPLVAELARMGIASRAVNLAGGTVATSLLTFAESLPPPVLLVAPVGERDGRIPGDVTHQLLQRGRWPVLASLGRAPVA